MRIMFATVGPCAGTVFEVRGYEDGALTCVVPSSFLRGWEDGPVRASGSFLRVFLSVNSTLLGDNTRVFQIRSALGQVNCTYNTTRVGIFIVASDVIVAVRFPRRKTQARAQQVERDNKGSFAGLRRLGSLDHHFYGRPIPTTRLQGRFSGVGVGGAGPL